MGHKSASTVVGATDARSAVVQESASMVVGEIGARSATSSERIINQITTSQFSGIERSKVFKSRPLGRVLGNLNTTNNASNNTS